MTLLLSLVLAQSLNPNPIYKGTDGGWRLRTEQPAAGSAGLTNTELRATPVLVDIYSDGGAGTFAGLTDAQLRASAVPVSLTSTTITGTVATSALTDAQLRAAAVPVSGTVTTGGLTDTQLRATPVPVSGTVTATVASTTITGSVAVTGPLTDTQLRATPVPVSGTVTATGPLTDAQLRAAVVPVSLASTTITGSVAVTGPLTDTQLRATPVPVSGTVTATVASTTITGTVAVTGPLTDTQLRAVAVPVSGTVTATGPLTDTQLRATAVPVSLASTTITGTVAATQSGTWTERVVGNAGGVIDAANNAAAPANVLVAGVQLQTGASATAGTAGQVGSPVASLDHVLYVRFGGPVSWSCFVQAATVTTQCQAAPGAGLRLYVTSLACNNQAATVQGVDVVFGTGAACVTGITALTHKFQMGTLATTSSPDQQLGYWPTPLIPTAANAICVRPTAATAFGCTLAGYTAP